MMRGWKFTKFMDHYIETVKANEIRDSTLSKWYLHVKSINKIAPGLLVSDVDQNREVLQFILDEYGKTHRKATTLDFKNNFFSVGRYLQSEGIIQLFNTNGIKVHTSEDNMTIEERRRIADAKKSLSRTEFTYVRGKLKGLIESELKNGPTFVGSSRCPELMYYGQIYTALNTGARLGEILGITINDLDEENGIIDINKAWNYKTPNGGFIPTKNEPSIRKVAVSADCIMVLKMIMEWKIRFYKDNEDDIAEIEELPILIMPNYWLHNSAINHKLKAFLKDCSIEPVSFHKLRHSYISNLLDQGVDIKIVAMQVGHADTSMIMKTYGHILREKQDADIQKIRMITG